MQLPLHMSPSESSSIDPSRSAAAAAAVGTDMSGHQIHDLTHTEASASLQRGLNDTVQVSSRNFPLPQALAGQIPPHKWMKYSELSVDQLRTKITENFNKISPSKLDPKKKDLQVAKNRTLMELTKLKEQDVKIKQNLRTLSPEDLDKKIIELEKEISQFEKSPRLPQEMSESFKKIAHVKRQLQIAHALKKIRQISSEVRDPGFSRSVEEVKRLSALKNTTVVDKGNLTEQEKTKVDTLRERIERLKTGIHKVSEKEGLPAEVASRAKEKALLALESANREMRFLMGGPSQEDIKYIGQKSKELNRKLRNLSHHLADAYLILEEKPPVPGSPEAYPRDLNESLLGALCKKIAQDPNRISSFSEGSGGIYQIGSQQWVFKAMDEEPGMKHARPGAKAEDSELYPPGEGPIREYAACSSPLSTTHAALVKLASEKFRNTAGEEARPKLGLVTEFKKSLGSLESIYTQKFDAELSSLTANYRSERGAIEKDSTLDEADKQLKLKVLGEKFKEDSQAMVDKLDKRRKEVATLLGIPFDKTKPVRSEEDMIPFETLRQAFYDSCDPGEVQRERAIDICYVNTDANFGNDLMQIEQGKPSHVIAIDRGKILPNGWPEDYNYDLISARNTEPLKKPVDREVLKAVRNLDIDRELLRLDGIFTAQNITLSPIQKEVFQAHARFLKLGLREGYTLHHLMSFMLERSEHQLEEVFKEAQVRSGSTGSVWETYEALLKEKLVQ